MFTILKSFNFILDILIVFTFFQLIIALNTLELSNFLFPESCLVTLLLLHIFIKLFTLEFSIQLIDKCFSFFFSINIFEILHKLSFVSSILCNSLFSFSLKFCKLLLLFKLRCSLKLCSSSFKFSIKIVFIPSFLLFKLLVDDILLSLIIFKNFIKTGSILSVFEHLFIL